MWMKVMQVCTNEQDKKETLIPNIIDLSDVRRFSLVGPNKVEVFFKSPSVVLGKGKTEELVDEWFPIQITNAKEFAEIISKYKPIIG